MKTIMNKKGNGVVILTTDEYANIVDTVFKASMKVDHALEYANILNAERIHETMETDPEMKAAYRMAQEVSIKVLEDHLKIANESLKKLNNSF